MRSVLEFRVGFPEEGLLVRDLGNQWPRPDGKKCWSNDLEGENPACGKNWLLEQQLERSRVGQGGWRRPPRPVGHPELFLEPTDVVD